MSEEIEKQKLRLSIEKRLLVDRAILSCMSDGVPMGDARKASSEVTELINQWLESGEFIQKGATGWSHSVGIKEPDPLITYNPGIARPPTTNYVIIDEEATFEQKARKEAQQISACHDAWYSETPYKCRCPMCKEDEK